MPKGRWFIHTIASPKKQEEASPSNSHPVLHTSSPACFWFAHAMPSWAPETPALRVQYMFPSISFHRVGLVILHQRSKSFSSLKRKGRSSCCRERNHHGHLHG